jgi:hypothetical protein
MKDFLYTTLLALFLVALLKYAQWVIGAYQRKVSYRGTGAMSRNMANRRLWAAVLVGMAAGLIWMFLLVEDSPLMEPAAYWGVPWLTGGLPWPVRLLIFRRAIIMSMIALILSVEVVWLFLLAIFDVIEILDRYRAAARAGPKMAGRRRGRSPDVGRKNDGEGTS